MNLKKIVLLLGAVIILVMQPMWSRPKLNPETAPGGNFDLTGWTLCLPALTGNGPTEVAAGELAGSQGFSNELFYTNSIDGAMMLVLPQPDGETVPVSGRLEFREVTDGWTAYGNHSLEAEVQVPQLTEAVILAGIWQAWPHQGPLCELVYAADGSLTLEMDGDGAEEARVIPVGQAAVGKHFSYTLFLSEDGLDVNIDGHSTTVDVPQAFAGRQYYFRAGNAVRPAAAGTAANVHGTIVRFYRFSLKHE